MIVIMGIEYWSGGHIHDGRLVADLFQPIIQILGNPLTANDMIRGMVAKEIYLEVANAMDSIDINHSDSCMLGHFCLDVEGKKKLMQKAWALYKTCIMKEYNMGKFEAFYQANDKLFPTKVAARLISIGKGIGYLYH